ncbi:GNAT family N-acetyltransferase [Tenacibaculum finnmarkense genomovar ulcerans]|uniref:GNAT family N-acetyltransferase n=1 Tax=Tenacibaculum finnmarkense TaxID=2781243 RepID=UPI00187B93BA|nr:GNAT family N-acetyltransferase [Tenacibaculum finnmarkense]MBE7633167.1 GNAT family N-acetyltransferase [Tenacibaculum finnmarkense genomovar ulcerans]MCD8429081.1 GNAT family N-acetyltransferase [Tenacibaculum finnmarkense genomovar ulcerans]
MKIRGAEKKDLKEIVNLFKLLNSKHQSNRKDFKSSIELDWYKHVLKKSYADKNYIILVAESNNKIIGFIIGKIYLIKENLLLKNNTIGEILFINVLDNYKKQGVGKKLIEKTEFKLRENGATTLEIRVYDFNKEMFPEKFNFSKKLTVYEKTILDN